MSGISQAGHLPDKLAASVKERGLPAPEPLACPTTLWDVFGKSGHPVRATISDMGPLLLGRMLNLNDTQSGVLNLVFKIADDQGLLLLDLKDLRAMLQYVGDNARDFTTQYGNVSKATIGTIQRQLLVLDNQGGTKKVQTKVLGDSYVVVEAGEWRQCRIPLKAFIDDGTYWDGAQRPAATRTGSAARRIWLACSSCS